MEGWGGVGTGLVDEEKEEKKEREGGRGVGREEEKFILFRR